jgi:hypothetical protein
MSRVETDVFCNNLRVGKRLDGQQLCSLNRFRVREIKAQALWRNQRTFLRDMIAKGEPQRLVQQMSCGVVGLDRGATCVINVKRHRLTKHKPAGFNAHGMNKDIAELLGRLADQRPHARRIDHPGIAGLTAAFGVKWGLVQDRKP